MKKLLLATTAVAALTFGASAARAEIDLDLGGFFKGYAGYANQDVSGVKDTDIKRRSQIFFTGETTLDNGLTVGYHGELSQDNQDAFSNTTGATGMEESYLYMSGNWGRLNLGRENGAAYLLQVAAPSADANIDGQDIAFSFANLTASAGGAAGQFNGGNGVDLDYQQSGPTLDAQYADKITYLTPKFNGFQAGVSYTPTYNTKVRSTQQAGMSAQNITGQYALENLMEGAVRYDGEFSGVGVHTGGGYTTANQSVEVAGEDAYNEWNAGLKLTFEGFGVGAAYNTDNQALEDFDTTSWTVGTDYTYGAYTFGASYFTSEADVSASTSDELDRYTVGANYTYGPGMSFRGAVAYFDYDAATAADNEATVVTIGTDVQF
jgi:outer membrane protein OmpU